MWPGDPLGDSRPLRGLLDRPLQDGRVLVVAGDAVRARVPGEARCGKGPLPPPVAGCGWMLAAQGIG